jgi:hypothetical protein
MDKMPDCPEVSRVMVRLDSNLGDVGDILVGLSVNGLRSNRVRVGIGHIGGGPPDDPAPGYAISGQVVDASGNPLNGVTVNLANSTGATLTTALTSGSGTFSFNGLPPGTSVTVAPIPTTLFSFSPTTFTNLSADKNAMFLGQPRFYSVSGKVTTVGSIGLSNATITCNDGLGTTTTLSDLNGNYSFAQMTAGRTLVISAVIAGFSVANPTAQIPMLECDKTGIDFVASAVPSPTPIPTSTPTPSPTATPTPIPGPTFHVATNGKVTGNGTVNSPWDLQTALSQPSSVVPGSTIYLHGGTYRGKFTSNLNGTAANPIVVRSYPGEWAKIDGYWTSSLGVALPSLGSPSDTVTVVLSNDVGYPEGTKIIVGREQIYLGGKQSDGVTWKNSGRGNSATPIAAHNAGEVVYNGEKTITVNGSYTYYRDFEVFNSLPIRSYDFPWTGVASVVRGSGIFVNPSTGLKFVNLVLHDNQEAIYLVTGAIDAEVYGCIIFNNGFVDWDRGHGQGLYMANDTGQKKVRNVLSFNNFSDGMKAYAESGSVKNFLYEHIISFNNGAPSTFPGNHGNNGAALTSTHRDGNMFAGTGSSLQPVVNVQVDDCYLYFPFDAKPEGGNLSFGYQGRNSTGIEIINSRIMGGNNTLVLNRILGITMTGNTFYEQTTSLGNVFNSVVAANFETGYTATVNSNTYLTQQPAQGSSYYPFRFAVNGIYTLGCGGGTALRYTCPPDAIGAGGWKENSRFDSTRSSWTNASPTGTEVFVIPNEYEIGRAHIAIYNWALSPTVPVDLSNVLTTGDHYVIYAAEDYLGAPVATGTYNGQPVSIPMTGTLVAAPIGLGWTPASVRPQFGAFVVRKG